MKKTILLLAMLVIAMTAGAQTIKTGFKKGDVRKYKLHADMSIGVPMQGERKGTADIASTYTVDDASADGWTVTMAVDSVAMTGMKEVVEQAFNKNLFGALKKTPAKVKLDKKGQVTDVLNSDAVLASIAELSIASINELYAKNPQIEQVAPKAKALMKVNDLLTKDNLIKQIKDNSVFGFNGKDINTTAPADEKLFDLFNTKATYTVSNANGKTEIVRSSTANMSESDTKEFLKKQIQNSGMQVDDATIEQAWGQLKAFGMTGVDIDDSLSATYDNAGWLTTSSESTNAKITGATIKVSATTTLQ